MCPFIEHSPAVFTSHFGCRSAHSPVKIRRPRWSDMHQVTQPTCDQTGQDSNLAFCPFPVFCCFQKVRQAMESPINEEEMMDSFWEEGEDKKDCSGTSFMTPHWQWSHVIAQSSLATASPAVAWAALPALAVTHLRSNVAVAQPCLASFWLQLVCHNLVFFLFSLEHGFLLETFPEDFLHPLSPTFPRPSPWTFLEK